ncbi:MAG TPA: DUF3109 domain-containing protein [Cytophagales bacterium]|nr:DUF3109 domain-containing protein [Cytophagales bacterium]HAA19606.1 DUF3109 domain-containing protein [Cytophagales bacterium]HAP60274.1 DUF3109 domain-containing protein [Cytophagales bacterium]
MLVLDSTIISDDVVDQKFVCDLNKCKGACCVEGDLGAPLDQNELLTMEEILPEVMPYLSEEGRQVLEKEGAFVLDEEGDFSTPTIEGRECAYAYYDEQQVLKCGIEQAYLDKKINFKKPISCHLYPIRISRYEHYEAINYHEWSICSPACELGESLKVPVYQFLKEPLIRKYGEGWYADLETKVEENSRTEEHTTD